MAVQASGDEPVVAGRYRVLRLIARGGMAAVYLAEHIQLRRQVALKVLYTQPDAEDSNNFEQRFRIEAETLATLDHANIVTLYDYGQADDGRFFLAMEYIDGPRFTDVVANGRLEPDRAIELLMQVCAALRYAHKRGVVHRDLKPSNLLLRVDGEGVERVKVVDFGLAKVTELDQSLTRPGLVLGSPHCMAPEQVKGLAIDHRADIYAIGVLLFRALTGSYPYHASTGTGTMIAHLQEAIPTFASVAPDVHAPPQLEAVVRRCLAKAPDERFPDVRALMDALAACAGAPIELDTQSSASLASPGPPPTAPAPRSRAPIVAGFVAFLALLLAAAWWMGRDAPTPVVEPVALPEPPTVEAPVVEAPKVEQPVVEAPKVEQPKVEQPKVDPPKQVSKQKKPPDGTSAPKDKPSTPEGYMPLPDDFQ